MCFKVSDIVVIYYLLTSLMVNSILMPCFHLIDNEYFNAVHDPGITKCRNELPLLTEYSKYQLLNTNANLCVVLRVS